MALVKISELPSASTLTGLEEYPFVQSGNTRKGGAGAGGSIYVGPPAPGATSGKDKTAVQNAINLALAQLRGGSVQFGAGTYDVGDLAILWPEFAVTGKQLTLHGIGDKATILKFSVDRGPGTYAIAGDYANGALRSDQSGLYENLITDMRIIGPGVRGTMGTAPCNMNGVMLDTHVKMVRTDISLFRSAINAAGNHNSLIDCTLGNNYYGAYFTATPGLGGSVVFYNCGLAGNLHSSIAVAPAALASFAMYEGHLGFNPYCVYMETGRVAGSAALTQCMFSAVNFEFIGNGFLYSEDQNAMVTECRWIGCANFSSNNATYGLPASAHTTQIRLHTLSNSDFIQTDLAGSPTLSYLDISTVLSNVSFDFGKRLVTASKTRAVPLVLGPASANLASIRLRDNDFRAVVLPADSTAVVADRLIEKTQFGRAQPHGTYGGLGRFPPIGVSQNSVAGDSRTWVIVAQEGTAINIDIDGAEPTATQVLVPSSTTASKVMAATYNGTAASTDRPIIGQLYFGGLAGAGKTQANINFQGA